MDTAGKNATKIQEYIQHQLDEKDKTGEQLRMPNLKTTRLRVASSKLMQMSGRVYVTLGAAGMRGLCPHMKYPRLCRGIFIISGGVKFM